ncbi:MAG: class I SAM-dependent methyltransferase [Candidatus Sigynarchaeota archaeon]
MPAPYAKSREVAAKYDATADEHYDLRYKDVQFSKYDLLLAYAERLLGSDVARRCFAGVIVDSGCGSGLLIQWLARRGLLARARVIGIDISARMLVMARQKSRRRPGIDLITANAELPPLRNGIASCVLSVSTYQNLDDAQQALYLPALLKILHDGPALLLFSTLANATPNDEIESIVAWARVHFPHVIIAPDDRRVEDRLIVCATP